MNDQVRGGKRSRNNLLDITNDTFQDINNSIPQFVLLFWDLLQSFLTVGRAKNSLQWESPKRHPSQYFHKETFTGIQWILLSFHTAFSSYPRSGYEGKKSRNDILVIPNEAFLGIASPERLYSKFPPDFFGSSPETPPGWTDKE